MCYLQPLPRWKGPHQFDAIVAEATVACCLPEGCQDIPADDCADISGLSLGPASRCDQDSCPQIAVELAIDVPLPFENFSDQGGCGVTAAVQALDDPLSNSSYTYLWSVEPPADVIDLPETVDGGRSVDDSLALLMPTCEQQGVSASGDSHLVRLTVIGEQFGNGGVAEIPFTIRPAGDVNDDGTVDELDRDLVSQFWASGSADGITLSDADVSCDGEVNVLDRAIVNAIWRGVICQPVRTAAPMRKNTRSMISGSSIQRSNSAIK